MESETFSLQAQRDLHYITGLGLPVGKLNAERVHKNAEFLRGNSRNGKPIPREEAIKIYMAMANLYLNKKVRLFRNKGESQATVIGIFPDIGFAHSWNQYVDYSRSKTGKEVRRPGNIRHMVWKIRIRFPDKSTVIVGAEDVIIIA